ncbi:MAG: hypothetical protein KDJ25_17765 [Rhodoblastus sp.]|nr:hypothetical protein [Rhodoblastus sp.]
MRTRRIHVTGASGAGVTTLGRAVAATLALPHHDVDDYFWLPTDPPYREKRPPADRLRLMREVFLGRPGWTLSGALEGWGDELAPLFDLVVYVSAPTDLRLDRLRQREATHFGATAIAPGGWRHGEYETFVAWAARYDEAGADVRSRLRHESWLGEIGRPVLWVDGRRPPADLAQEVRAYFSSP